MKKNDWDYGTKEEQAAHKAKMQAIREEFHFTLVIADDRVEIIDYFDRTVFVVKEVADIKRFCTEIKPGCTLHRGYNRNHPRDYTDNAATIALIEALH